MSRIVATQANLLAFAALAAVLAYWGWRWFGPAAVHIPPAPLADPAAAFAVSTPFGSGSIATEAPPVPAALAGDTRLLGVLAEPDGKGRALLRFADVSARLIGACEALPS